MCPEQILPRGSGVERRPFASGPTQTARTVGFGNPLTMGQGDGRSANGRPALPPIHPDLHMFPRKGVKINKNREFGEGDVSWGRHFDGWFCVSMWGDCCSCNDTVRMRI